MVFLPIIMALVGGQSFGAVLAGLSVTQWTAIAEELLNATPSIIQAFADLHPSLQGLAELVAKTLPAEQIGAQAMTSFQQWAAANPGAPYYKGDGTVGET